MLFVGDYIDNLLHIATKRYTHYNNHFPFNCGYIDFDKSLSFDCIGLIKSEINEPDIATRTAPVGYYVRPSQVVPDWYGELELFNSGEEKRYENFHKSAPGSFLYLKDAELGFHGGVYVGDYGNVNVVECTRGWGCDGVVMSWVDNDGTRRDQKNGNILGRWTGSSALTMFINYNDWYQNGKDSTWFYGCSAGWLFSHQYNGWFRLGDGGRMMTGWFYDDYYKGWFYLNPKNNGKFYTGQMVTGWLWDDYYNAWYYLCPKNDGKFYTGQMVTGDYVINGKKYHFADSGKLV